MKVLFVFDRPFIPSRGGAEVRALSHLDYFESRGITCDLFLIDRYNNYQLWRQDDLNALKESRNGDIFLHRAIGLHPDVIYRKLMILATLLSGELPDAAHPIHALPGMIRYFRRIVSESSYNLIFFNHSYYSGALAKHTDISCKTVIDTHDIYTNLLNEIYSLKKQSKINPLVSDASPAKKIQHYIYHKFSSFEINYELSLQRELKLLSLFDRIIAIAPNELDLIKQCVDLRNKSYHIPMIAPDISLLSRIKVEDEIFKLMFIGSQYDPNVEAIYEFCTQVLPKLNDKVYLYLVGGVSNSQDLPSDSRIVRLGFVENLDELYSQIDAVVLPLSFGSGVSVKAVEALAHGKPVVSMPKGVRGLAVAHEKEVLIAQTFNDFIPLIQRLMIDHELQRFLRTGALNYIQKYHSKSAVYSSLDSVIFD
ncbi:glycosyltransferase [Lyngbya confervoides]|uniref:Glycosyltransferase n=1 Tax=Lyngbya confervoides BDU141951 TaxID=1574623 RepID=A0ABD4T943_9CYAN|nr:glycosyltransferase [Lyngbya confervoides]MCM1985146.1 glycosyltransferase [Lyngbya confervoides BDU141951]